MSERMLKIERLLIAFAIFALPLGTRTALWRFSTYPDIPYLTVFLYGTDMLALLLVGWWIFSLRAKIFSAFANLPACATGVLLACSVISALQSEVPLLGLITMFRTLFIAAFAFLLAWRARTALSVDVIIIPLFASGVVQAALAWYQFLRQQDAGLRILGEQVLGVGTAGVAKLDMAGEKIIRAYGTFPHPNVLGAFLMLVLVLSAAYFLSRFPKNFFMVVSWLGGIALMLGALLFTFSRAAWLGLVLACCFLVFASLRKLFQRDRDLLRDTMQDFRHRMMALGILLIGFMLFATLAFSDAIKSRTVVPPLESQSVQMRVSGAYLAALMIAENRLLGTGPGQFTLHMDRFTGKLAESWMYQPVHALYLLIGAEYGIIGLLCFLFFIFSLFRHWHTHSFESHEWSGLMRWGVVSACIAFLFIGATDHFFLTFQQGAFLFWLSAALMLA